MDGHDQAGEPPIRFRVLGPLEVSDGTRSLPLGGLTQRTFLAYLLLHANRAVPLAQVIDALWGANPPPSAKNMLHNAVWRLRKLLSGIDGAELVSQKPGYLLRIPPELLDVHHFQRLLELGRTASAAGGTHSATAIFREALALWRGPADFGGRPWPILAVLEESRLGAWEECFEAELSLGRHREVISELTELVAAEPLRERLCGQLMLALYRSGRQAEALTAYRRIRAKCATELGIEPGPELRRLERAILNQDAGLSGPQEVRPAGDGERWKRRQLSALLVRLAGETAHQLVSVVRAEAERFGGVVVSAIGTTVLTLFGAECTREDDPARAVGAALSLKDRLGDADVRMTVTTGVVPVSSGPGGAPIVAAGLEPGLALLDTAGPQEIRVCPDTYAMSRALIEYTAGRIPVAKRSEPAPPDAGPIRLVGRDRELATLRRALDDTVRTRRPQLVTLLGGAGAGKSRLVAELVHAAETRIGPVLAVVSRTHPFSRDPAFHGLATIVRACLGIDPPEHGPRTGEVRRAWAAFLDELAAERPLAVVFEDVHLAEDALLGFLDELPGRLGHVPLLLVVTARPELLERRPDWGGGKPDATTLTLEPLSAPETAGLLHELFREHGVPEVSRDGEFWHALVTAVGGNPLFAGEYVRMVENRRELWTDTEPLPLPARVRTVIAARLDALPEDEQALLRDAAVLGTTLWPRPVARLSGRSPGDVERLLGRLVRKEILRRNRRSSVAGQIEYAFAHTLIRDLAWERNPVPVRAEKHRLAAAWLETVPVDHAELLAHHYGQAVALTAAAGKPVAELATRARAALARAGRRAAIVGAHRAAVRCHRAALELCPPHDPARPELLLRYGKSLAAWQGGGVDVLTEAREALLFNGNLAGAASADSELATLTSRRGGANAVSGRDRVLALLRDAPPSETVAETQCTLAIALVADGRHTEAEELAEHALAVAEDFARPDLTASALQARGTARVDRGDLRGAGDFESAVETCRRYGLSPARALGGLGWASARTGDLGRFSGIRAEAMDAAERYGDVLTLRMLRGRAVIEHYWAGEWDEADELATRMLRGAEPDWLPARVSWHVVRGRIALARGDHPAATGDAVRGLAIARPAGPRELGPALAFAARIALVRGKTAEARRLAEELLTALRGRTIPAAVGIDLPVVLAALGQGVAAFAGLRWSPWLAAAEAFLRGDLATAAEGYYWIGSRPDRLAARSLRTVA